MKPRATRSVGVFGLNTHGSAVHPYNYGLVGSMLVGYANQQTCRESRVTSSMPLRSTLLSNFPVINSRDPEFIRDQLFGFYGASSFDTARDKSDFAVHANHLQIGGL